MGDNIQGGVSAVCINRYSGMAMVLLGQFEGQKKALKIGPCPRSLVLSKDTAWTG